MGKQNRLDTAVIIQLGHVLQPYTGTRKIDHSSDTLPCLHSAAKVNLSKVEAQ